MLTITEGINFRREIEQELQLTNISDFQLIGEELNQRFLFKVNEYQKEESISLRTHVVLYNGENKKSQILYTFKNVSSIFQASINQGHSILAFVTKDIDASIYDHLQHEAWILSLNSLEFPKCLQVKSRNPIHVHFRYFSRSNTKPSINDELLLFTLKESIILYHLRDDPSKKLGYTFGEAIAIVKRFFSAQWSPIDQCLYYTHYRLPNKLSDTEPVEEPCRLMLTCLQFHDNIHYETVLHIPLELLNVEKNAEIVKTGSMQGSPHRISDGDLDIEVLTLSSGVVCICLQHFTQLLTDPYKDNFNEKAFAANYLIVLLHHGCIIQCAVPEMCVSHTTPIQRIIFSLYMDYYILAILPGAFVHLLDIGLQHDPCNHVLLQNCNLKLQAGYSLRCTASVNDFPMIYDSENNNSFGIMISCNDLMDCFKSTQQLSTRLAIIHQLVVHFKVKGNQLKSLVRRVVEESSCLERSKLMEELLIGGTYISCSESHMKEFLKAIQMTLSESRECQLEQVTTSATKTVELTYVPLPHTSVTLLSVSQRLRPSESDVWSKLWRHLEAMKCYQPETFSTQLLRDRLMVSMEYSHQGETPSECSSEAAQLNLLVGKDIQFDCHLDKPSTSTSGNFETEERKECEVSLPFPEREDASCSQFEQVASMNLREMTMHLLKCFSGYPPPVIHRFAEQYVANQLFMTRLLCHHLYAICDENYCFEELDSAKPFDFLNNLSACVLRRIFSLLTEYQVAVSEIAYPTPQGFQAFLAILGFKRLDQEMFMQYVDRGALQLRNEVVCFIMADLDDSDVNVKFKLDLLMKLPHNKMWRFLETWDHPISRKILSRKDFMSSTTSNPKDKFGRSDREKLSLQLSSNSMMEESSVESIVDSIRLYSAVPPVIF